MLFRNMVRLGVIRFNQEDGDGSKDSGGGGGGAAKVVAPSRVVERLIARFGSAEAALGVLAGENFSHRTTIRDLEARLATAGERAPKEGQLVLSREQAAEFQAFQDLGKLDEVKQKLTDAEQLSAKLSAREYQDTIQEATKLAGFANGVVLGDLLRARGLKVEMKEETVDGKAVKAPYVREGEGDPLKLVTYIEEKAPDYKVALGANGGEPSKVRRFPAQGSGEAGKSQPGDKVSERLERRAERATNALTPKVTT
jgi:hypothetical protein